MITSRVMKLVKRMGAIEGWLGFCLSLSLLMGCAPTLSKTPKDLRGEAWEAFRAVDAIKQLESSNPSEAVQVYEKVLQREGKFSQSFHQYQRVLQTSLGWMQDGIRGHSLDEEAALGLPDIYVRRVLMTVRAHQGLARIHATQGRWVDAERHAMDGIETLSKRAHVPFFRVQSQIESYQLLQDIYGKQGKVGRALMAKLNSDLLTDHLQSANGSDDFLVDKALLYGEVGQKQFAAVQQFVIGVNEHRLTEFKAQMQAYSAALNQAEASLLAVGAEYALEKSGGVVTPEVQQLQMYAQLAQFQADIQRRLTEGSANQMSKIHVQATPWAIPTFTQQLVSPKQGANTPTIMKGFATSAVQAGGASYQAGAQQVNDQVDALMPYRQSGSLDGATKEVEKFADVFNAFLTQVQEIKK